MNLYKHKNNILSLHICAHYKRPIVFMLTLIYENLVFRMMMMVDFSHLKANGHHNIVAR